MKPTVTPPLWPPLYERRRRSFAAAGETCRGQFVPLRQRAEKPPRPSAARPKRREAQSGAGHGRHYVAAGPRELLNRYTIAAADRTRKEGKVISAQEIMIEVLERGSQVKS